MSFYLNHNKKGNMYYYISKSKINILYAQLRKNRRVSLKRMDIKTGLETFLVKIPFEVSTEFSFLDATSYQDTWKKMIEIEKILYKTNQIGDLKKMFLEKGRKYYIYSGGFHIKKTKKNQKMLLLKSKIKLEGERKKYSVVLGCSKSNFMNYSDAYRRRETSTMYVLRLGKPVFYVRTLLIVEKIDRGKRIIYGSPLYMSLIGAKEIL